jgi:hypothetical protein
MTKDAIPAAVEQAIRSLSSGGREGQGASFETLREATAGKVGWADRAWDTLMPLLQHKDNRVRSIAGQTLCNLARSASTGPVERDFDALMAATHDERFVTARHVLLALWKVGMAGPELRARLLNGYSERFRSSAEEKNGTLVRYDILCAMRSLYDETGDEAVKAAAMTLISIEQDDKYRKKYAGAWRGA